MERLLTPREVCPILRVSPQTVRRLIKERRIPFVVITAGAERRTVRIPENALAACIAQQVVRVRKAKGR